MLGGIKNLFGEKKLEIRIDDIPRILEERFRSDASRSLQSAAGQAEEIINEFESLKKMLSELFNKKGSDAFSESLKNKFCLRAAAEAEKIGIPKKNYESIKNFIHQAKNSLAEIGNISIKELRHLQAFRDGMKDISAKTREIEGKIKRMSLKNLEIARKMDEINKKIGKIKMLEEMEKNYKIRSEETEKINEELHKKIEEKKSEYHNFLRSEKFGELNGLKNDIADMEGRKKIIRQRIVTEFGISRALKKFCHESIEKNERHLAEKYIDSPADAFIEDMNMEIEFILDKIEEKPFLDRHEKDKISGLKKRIYFLVQLRSEYFFIEKSIKEKKSLLPSYDYLFENKRAFEREIDEMNKIFLGIKKEEFDGREIEGMRREIKEMLSELMRKNVIITE